MNRLKKELMKKGVKLEHQYDTLPSPEGIQGVTVNSGTATWSVYHTSITTYWELNRAGEIHEKVTGRVFF